MKNQVRFVGAIFAITLFLFVSVIFIIATCGKALLNSSPFVGPDDPQPSWTASEARSKGVWVCDVMLSPRELTWKGKTIAFGDAWIEEATRLDHQAVWIPYYQRIGGYYLCFTLASGKEIFEKHEEDHPFFVLGENHESFGSQNTAIFYQRIADWKALSTQRISFTTSFKEKTENITITPKE